MGAIYEAIIAEIMRQKAQLPPWFGGKSVMRIPLKSIGIDVDRQFAYVTLEDLAAACVDDVGKMTNT